MTSHRQSHVSQSLQQSHLGLPIASPRCPSHPHSAIWDSPQAVPSIPAIPTVPYGTLLKHAWTSQFGTIFGTSHSHPNLPFWDSIGMSNSSSQPAHLGPCWDSQNPFPSSPSGTHLGNYLIQDYPVINVKSWAGYKLRVPVLSSGAAGREPGRGVGASRGGRQAALPPRSLHRRPHPHPRLLWPLCYLP